MGFIRWLLGMEKEEEETTEDTFSCDTCGRNFGSQRGLSIHETRTHDEDTVE